VNPTPPNDDWYRKIDNWKAQMDIVIPQVQDKVEKQGEAITALQTSNATEESRTRQVVVAVLKSGEFRLKNWMSLVTGLAAIAAIVYGALK
jgi:hypothetical protein